MAYDEVLDRDLVALPGRQLFEPSTTYIAFRRGSFLRRFMYEFLELFAPQLTVEQVDAAVAAPDRSSREALFEDVRLPER
jgi:LysR family cys regulon transcriptional activator